MLLNNQWITEEIKEEIRKYLETNENKNITIQNLQDTTKAVLRENFSDASLPQETRKISNQQPKLTPKGARKRRANKTQSRRRKKNHENQSRSK